jgi:hypothetical protein
MFRSPPKNLAFYGLEDGDRKGFSIERLRLTAIWPNLPDAMLMLSAFCGRLLAWSPCSCR